MRVWSLGIIGYRDAGLGCRVEGSGLLACLSVPKGSM